MNMSTVELLKSVLNGFKVWVDKRIKESISNITPTNVVPDYNQNDENAADYIKNRPFYSYDGDVVDVLPTTSLDFGTFVTTELVNNEYWYSYKTKLSVNYHIDEDNIDSFIVFVNDIAYENLNICEKEVYFDSGIYKTVYGITDNFETFQIYQNFERQLNLFYVKDPGTYTFRIQKRNETINKIDLKYISTTNKFTDDSANRFIIPTSEAVKEYVKTCGRVLPLMNDNYEVKYYAIPQYTSDNTWEFIVPTKYRMCFVSNGNTYYSTLYVDQNGNLKEKQTDRNDPFTENVIQEKTISFKEDIMDYLNNMIYFNNDGELVVTIGDVSKTFVPKG